MSYRRQTSFFPAVKEFGGSLSEGKRKERRPVVTDRPMHLVLKSSNAVGVNSLHKEARWIESLLRKLSSRYFIHVFEYSNNGNHLHLVVQAKQRKLFSQFLMALSGRIAQRMTGSTKGKPLLQKFWDHIPFTRILEWGRDFRNAMEYVVQNYLEERGIIRHKPRRRKPVTVS